MPYANNKGADQPAHPRSLISTFVVRCLDRMIPLTSISEISSLYIASVVAQDSLSLPWSQTSKTGFLVTRLKLKQKVVSVRLNLPILLIISVRLLRFQYMYRILDLIACSA